MHDVRHTVHDHLRAAPGAGVLLPQPPVECAALLIPPVVNDAVVDQVDSAWIQ